MLNFKYLSVKYKKKNLGPIFQLPAVNTKLQLVANDDVVRIQLSLGFIDN